MAAQVKVVLEDGYVYVPSLEGVLDWPVWTRSEVTMQVSKEQFERFLRPLLGSGELVATETGDVLEGFEVAQAVGSTRLRTALRRLVMRNDTTLDDLRSVIDAYGHIAGSKQELVAANVDAYASRDQLLKTDLRNEKDTDVLHALLRSDHTNLSEDELASKLLWWAESSDDGLQHMLPHLRMQYVNLADRTQLISLYEKQGGGPLVRPTLPPRLQAWKLRRFRCVRDTVEWHTRRPVHHSQECVYERHFEVVGSGEVTLQLGQSSVVCPAGKTGHFTAEVRKIGEDDHPTCTVVWWVGGRMIQVRSFAMADKSLGLRASCKAGTGAPVGCSYVGRWGMRCADTYANVPVDLHIW